MAITSIKQSNKLKYLFSALAILIFIAVIIIGRNYFTGMELSALPPFEITEEKIIEIDFEVLKHPLLEELQLFPEIEPLAEEAGRENPFISY